MPPAFHNSNQLSCHSVSSLISLFHSIVKRKLTTIIKNHEMEKNIRVMIRKNIYRILTSKFFTVALQKLLLFNFNVLDGWDFGT